MPRADGRPTAQEKRDAAIAEANRRSGGKKEAAGPSDVEILNQRQFQDPGSAPAAAPIAKPQSAGAKVTVACKLGIAYYDIQLCKIEQKFEQNMQGGRNINEATRVGPVVRLRGTAYPRGTPPAGFPAAPEMVGGAALNRGVDKDFWDAWVEQNKLNPVVMNRMVFAHESEDHVRGQAGELSKFLSGLEPVNPKSDPRTPRSTRSDVTNVETEDSRAGKTAAA